MKRSMVILSFAVAALLLSGAALARCDEVVRSAHATKVAKSSQDHAANYRIPVHWRIGK